MLVWERMGSLLLLVFTLEGVFGLSGGATIHGLDCASSNFEFSEELTEWTNFLERMKKIQSHPNAAGEETRPVIRREETRTHRNVLPPPIRTPYTLLATFPHSGTSLVRSSIADLTNSCRYSEVKVGDGRDLQMSMNREMYARKDCFKQKGITSVSVALIKSHMKIEKLVKTCKGYSYSHGLLSYTTKEDWEAFFFDVDLTFWNITRGYAKIVRLIRNPWDNLVSRLDRMLSAQCDGNQLCEGFVHVNSSWEKTGRTTLVWVSEEIEFAALRLFLINDFIAWLTFHHRLALSIRRSRIPFLTVTYSEVLANPLKKILEIAKFVGYREHEMESNSFQSNLINLGNVCKDGRMVPVRLTMIPKEIRQELTSRLRAYLNHDPSWMKPLRDKEEVFPFFFKKCFGQSTPNTAISKNGRFKILPK